MVETSTDFVNLSVTIAGSANPPLDEAYEVYTHRLSIYSVHHRPRRFHLECIEEDIKAGCEKLNIR